MSVYYKTNWLDMVKISKVLSDSSRGIKVKNSRDYIALARKGLTVKQLNQILDFAKISLKQVSTMLSMSERQLSRYEEDKIFKRDISAHLIQITELYRFGYEVFEDEIKFQAWMNSEIRALGGQKPINLLDTPFGINDVRNIIGRLEYSVYS